MRSALLAMSLLAACSTALPLSRTEEPAPPSSPEPAPAAKPARSPLHDQAIAGVDSAELSAVLGDHWESVVTWSPTYATTLGDHRFDDRLGARDEAAFAAMRSQRDAFLSRAERIAEGSLSERDRITWALFVEGLRADQASDVCRQNEWQISARENEFAGLSYELGEGHLVKTPDDGRNLLSRLSQAPKRIDDAIVHLRKGAADGYFASRESLRRTVEQLDVELGKPVKEWALSLPTKQPHADWPNGEAARFQAELLRLVEADIKPAVTRYRDAVRDELLPRARGAEAEGLSFLPAGDACYRALVRVHLGMERDPKELHALGLAQIADSDKAIAQLGKKLFKARNLKATIEHLRKDRALYFTSAAEIVKRGEELLARAEARVPKYFGILPKQGCVVREIPAHEAPYTTVAYYREPHFDGTKPGEYFVNTFKPEVRTRWDFEVLSYHESVPGHHLQIALAQELGELPLVRKLWGSTAFVEGWALYTERLADEMGLYDGDLGRLGMWSFDAWRGARLVVDTGLHSLGWSREQAEKFMLEHTALTPENVSNEVDRYLSTPGQALAYKVGQLEILALRAQVEKKLGDRFDVRAFHDVVLSAGAVSMPVLRARVADWAKL